MYFVVADSNVNSSANGTASAQILDAPEEKPTPKVILFENGSSSNSKSYSPPLATSDKVSTSNAAANIKEFDLEKVLEEQETHDLYCPNCNSCITRRVILKKRKRIAKDVKPDSRPEKLPNLGQIETANEDLDGREQTNVLFKCLSCFSFFIPTGLYNLMIIYFNLYCQLSFRVSSNTILSGMSITIVLVLPCTSVSEPYWFGSPPTTPTYTPPVVL